MFRIGCHQSKDVTTTLGILTYNPRYASSLIKKLLESTIANAENNNGMSPENRYIAECYANKEDYNETYQTKETRKDGLTESKRIEPHYTCVR